MIRLNFLPHRDEAKANKRQALKRSLLIAAFAGAAVVVALQTGLRQALSRQEDRNASLSAAVQELDGQIKGVSQLKGEIEILQAKQRAVEGLQSARHFPVRLFTELSRQVPDGVHLTAVKQDSSVIELAGSSQSQESVSMLLRNLNQSAEVFSRAELIEIVAATMPNSAKEQTKLFNFSIRAHILDASRRHDGVAAPAQPKSTLGKA